MKYEAGFVRIIGAVILLAAVVIGVFFFTSIGSFALDNTSETRSFNSLTPFDEISLKGSGTLMFAEGTTPGVSIESDTALLDKFEVTSEDGVLSIGMSELDTVRALKLPPETTKIMITAPELSSVSLSGSYGIHDSSRITGDNLAIESNGKVSGDLKITSNSSVLTFGGQHLLTLTGAAFNDLSITGNGSGKIDAHGLQTPDATLTLNGSLTVRVGSPQSATLDLNGASKVFFNTLPTQQFAVRTAGQSVVGLYDPTTASSTTPTTND